jgi:hypothetical protein
MAREGGGTLRQQRAAEFESHSTGGPGKFFIADGILVV